MELEEKEVLKTGWVKLGDVCEITKGKNKTIHEMTGTKYRVIGGGFIPMKDVYIDEFNADNKEILMSNDGAYAGYINRFDEKMFITGHCNKITAKTNYNINFIHYYLKIELQNKLLIHEKNGGYQTGQAQPSINKNKMLNEIHVPNLSKTHQQEIVDFLDKQFETYDINKLGDKLKNIKLFDLLINKQYDVCADALHLIYRKIEADALHKQFELDKKAIFNIQVNTVQTKEYKLGDIVDFKNGKGIKKDTLVEGEYPVIGGGQKPMGFHNKYNADENTILCSSSGAYAGFISKYDKKVWASDCFSIIPKNNSINNTYLYYLLKNIKDKIYKLQTGSAQPHIYSKNLQNIKIPIPSLKDQKKIIEEIEKVESEQSSYAKYAEILQKQIEQMNTTIKNICNIKQKEYDGYKSSEESDESKSKQVIKNKEKPVKKKLDKKKINSDSDSSENETYIIVKNITTEPLKSKKKKIPIQKDTDSDKES